MLVFLLYGTVICWASTADMASNYYDKKGENWCWLGWNHFLSFNSNYFHDSKIELRAKTWNLFLIKSFTIYNWYLRHQEAIKYNKRMRKISKPTSSAKNKNSFAFIWYPKSFNTNNDKFIQHPNLFYIKMILLPLTFHNRINHSTHTFHWLNNLTDEISHTTRCERQKL